MRTNPLSSQLIKTWRSVIVGDEKSWVLFANGTCVILMEPENDLRSQAVELMREYGPVHAGSSGGDFSTINLENEPGWVVTCHHPDILTYVSENDAGDEPTDVSVGLFGRSNRDTDSADLEVIHVEDNRS